MIVPFSQDKMCVFRLSLAQYLLKHILHVWGIYYMCNTLWGKNNNCSLYRVHQDKQVFPQTLTWTSSQPSHYHVKSCTFWVDLLCLYGNYYKKEHDTVWCLRHVVPLVSSEIHYHVTSCVLTFATQVLCGHQRGTSRKLALPYVRSYTTQKDVPTASFT